MQPTHDVVIIGAGPAGTTAAALLLQNGLRVLLVERSFFPRFVIGESLLPQCMDLLQEANLLEVVQSQNYQIKKGAVFLRNHTKEVFEFANQRTNGWDYTYQVPRADFDTCLAHTVEQRGVPIWFGHEVKSIDLSGGVPRISVCNQEGSISEITTRFVLDASGFGRVLPKLLQLDQPSSLLERKAVFAHLREEKNREGIEYDKIWICIHPLHHDMWYWVIPFSNGLTSVGVVAPPHLFSQFNGDDTEILQHLLREEPGIRERFPEMDFVFLPRSITGYSSSVKRFWGKGFAILGHAGEFLDPIFSSGVTISLKSANLAAKTIARELNGESLSWDEDYVKPLLSGVEVFRTYVKAWYDGRFQRVIFYDQKPREFKEMICSVLAGYAWDEGNPFVNEHGRRLNDLAHLCRQKISE